MPLQCGRPERCGLLFLKLLLPECSCETTVMFVAIAGMFLGTTVMFVVTTVLLFWSDFGVHGRHAMFAGGTVMFTRATVMSVAATVMFVAADANQAFLGARRLCTRENALFVRKTGDSAGKPQMFAPEASDFPFSVKRSSYSRSRSLP